MSDIETDRWTDTVTVKAAFHYAAWIKPKPYFCANAIKDVIDKKTAPSDESSRSIRVWDVVSILKVSFSYLS